jgi:hypothetical protein
VFVFNWLLSSDTIFFLKKVWLILLMVGLAAGVSLSLSWAQENSPLGVGSFVGDSSNTDTSGGSFSLINFTSTSDARSWGENSIAGGASSESQEGHWSSFVDFLAHNNSDSDESQTGHWSSFVEYLTRSFSDVSQIGQWSSSVDTFEDNNWKNDLGQANIVSG